MRPIRRINLGVPTLLEFRGPDALRFLNGQLTQDVRAVAGGRTALPSCVTDAKGRLQFRAWLTEGPDGALWVEGPPGTAGELEARLTRYLIADDVETADLTGKWSLQHFTGVAADVPADVLTRACMRLGVLGTDWWIPAGNPIEFPKDMPLLEGDELETLRINNGVPAWGRELEAGLLPPEAGLDLTDVSYRKGCYIGQEVISRIKSAGRVNKRLVRITLGADIGTDLHDLLDPEGKTAGRITSVSPLADGGVRHALGYVKRGVERVELRTADGRSHPVAFV